MVKANTCVECGAVIGLVKTRDSISLCNECNNKYITGAQYHGKKPVWHDFVE